MDKGELILRWINWADTDYIAARQLLLSNALVPGSGLSNTAIEKYLKALFVFLDLEIPKGYAGHNICNLYETLNKKGLGLKLNQEYLALLFKSYPLRYPDDLKIGFNIVLCRTKLLVELDHTVFEIKRGISLKRGGKEIDTFEDNPRMKDPALLNKNCYFGGYNREALFKEHSSCYELRVFKDRGLVETFILHDGIIDNGKFDVEALKPDGKDKCLFGERSPILAK